MGFVSWLTGRNGVYADQDKIEKVIEELTTIKDKELEEAKDTIAAEIKKLNNCTGFTKYVSDGNMDPHSFDAVIESGQDSIKLLIDEINKKSKDMKAYSEASFGTKVFSTLAMAGAKFGEGVLSVGEDIGDAAVSVVGWVAPKDSGVEKWCAKFVKKEWSHDAFNFYYKSEFAKASAFTEDSALAAGFKIAGSTAGYLALGGAVAGAAGTAGAAANAGKVAKAANVLVGNTTRANTMLAAVTGLGSGTEHGLRSGKTMNQSFGTGVKQAAIQGAVAYGAGKYGEHLQKQKAIKVVSEEVDNAAAKVTEAQNVLKANEAAHASATDDVANAAKSYGSAKDTYLKAIEAEKKIQAESGKALDNAAKIAKGKGDYAPLEQVSEKYKDVYKASLEKVVEGKEALNSAQETFEQARKVASAAKSDVSMAQESLYNAQRNKAVADKALDIVENAKLSNFQGYSDPITKAGQRFGSHPVTSVKNAASSAKNNVVNAAGAVKSGQVFKEGAKKAVNAGSSLKSGARSALETAKELGVIESAQAVGSKAVGAVKTGAAVTTTAVVGTAKAAAANPGTTGAVLNATGREISNHSYYKNDTSQKAAQQFRKSITEKEFDNQFDENDSKLKSSGNTIVETDTTPDYGYDNENYHSGSDYSDGGYQARKTTPKSTKTTTPKTDNKKAEDVMTPTTPPDSDKAKERTITTPPSQVPTTEPSTDTIVEVTPTTPTVDQTTTSPIEKETLHTGGSYSESTTGGDGGYYDYSGDYTDSSTETDTTTTDTTDMIGDIETPIDDVIATASDYTKIPTSNDPITTSSKSGGSSVIPIAAGLSAAAAAGIGAKAYMDRKRNNEDGEEDFVSDEWDGDESTDIEYSDGVAQENYLDDDNNDYGYQEEQVERYGARTNEELADLQ